MTLLGVAVIASFSEEELKNLALMLSQIFPENLLKITIIGDKLAAKTNINQFETFPMDSLPAEVQEQFKRNLSELRDLIPKIPEAESAKKSKNTHYRVRDRLGRSNRKFNPWENR